jgi:hypothetical protein
VDTNILRNTPEEVPAAELVECFACYRGVVCLGHLIEDPETGEEVEVIEAVPCRRCRLESL